MGVDRKEFPVGGRFHDLDVIGYNSLDWRVSFGRLLRNKKKTRMTLQLTMFIIFSDGYTS